MQTKTGRHAELPVSAVLACLKTIMRLCKLSSSSLLRGPARGIKLQVLPAEPCFLECAACSDL